MTVIKVFFLVFLLEAVVAFFLLIADLLAKLFVFSNNINIRRLADKSILIANYMI